MKALSIRPPFIWTILYAGKDIENRTWGTRVVGTIALHASSTVSKQEWEDLSDFLKEHGLPSMPPKETLVKGAIVGVVDIVGCHNPEEGAYPSLWYGDEYGFVLENPRPLPIPIPIKGKLNLWTIPKEIEEQIWAQIPQIPPNLNWVSPVHSQKSKKSWIKEMYSKLKK